MIPMTEHEMDELFERRRKGESVDSILASLPVDGAARQMAADLLLVDDVLRHGPRPMPPVDFAEIVVSRANEPVRVASSAMASNAGWTDRRVWGATALAALSACVLLAVTWVTPPAPARIEQAANNAAPAPIVAASDQAPVPDAVRHGTQAYMELVGSFASTVTTTPAPERASDVQLASASPIGRALQGSSATIRDAGEGLRAGVEPITSSALDAFGFLWRPTRPEEDRPST